MSDGCKISNVFIIFKDAKVGAIRAKVATTLTMDLWPMQGLAKVQAKSESPWITFHAPRSVRKCEGMNPHTPKWAPTLGVGVLMDSWIFKRQLQGSQFIGLKISLYHWKAFGMQMFKMRSHDPFKYLKHKLWPKERIQVKLPIWLLTIKSQELPWFTNVQVACHISLKNFRQGLQLCFTPHFNWRFTKEIMGLKVARIPISRISRLQFESRGTKWHLGASPMARHKIYYKRWWV